MKLAPIYIHFMLHCHFSPDPMKELGYGHWHSSMGTKVRQWLIANGLVTTDYKSTIKGKAWVKMICATPLPVADERWIDPRTNDAIELS
jgi:hypothetical protein